MIGEHFLCINDALMGSLEKLLSAGHEIVVRGNKTIEIVDYNFQIIFPQKRALALPHRFNCIAATIAETLWVFSGRNDLDFLRVFLPNADNWSDDRETWRGAYGPRLRIGSIPDEVVAFVPSLSMPMYCDQIRNVFYALSKDPNSREAVIIIPAPEDYSSSLITKDRPCTIFIQFLIRNNHLDCFVKMRSNDIIWGAFNINVFEWSFLQEIVAGILDIQIGSYYHNAVSFHIYETMFKRAAAMMNAKLKYSLYVDEGFKVQPFKFQTLNDFFSTVNFAIQTLERAKAIATMGADKEQIKKQVATLHRQFFVDLPKEAKGFITFLNIPLSYILTQQDPSNVDQIMATLFAFPESLDANYVIPHLDWLYRKLPEDTKQKMIDIISDNFIWPQQTIKFICQEWD